MKPAHRKIVLASSFVAFAAACGWVGASSYSPGSLFAVASAGALTLHSFFKLLGEVERPEPEHREVVTMAEIKTADSDESVPSPNVPDGILREVNFAALMEKRDSLNSSTLLKKRKVLSHYDGMLVQWEGEIFSVLAPENFGIGIFIRPPIAERKPDIYIEPIMAVFPDAKESDFVNIDIGDLVIVCGKIKVLGSGITLANCELIRHERKIK